jgi:hypothetical protein
VAQFKAASAWEGGTEKTTNMRKNKRDVSLGLRPYLCVSARDRPAAASCSH